MDFIINFNYLNYFNYYLFISFHFVKFIFIINIKIFKLNLEFFFHLKLISYLKIKIPQLFFTMLKKINLIIITSIYFNKIVFISYFKQYFLIIFFIFIKYHFKFIFYFIIFFLKILYSKKLLFMFLQLKENNCHN